MKPFAAGLPRSFDSDLNDRFCEATALVGGGDHGVEDEGVLSAIPGDVHKSDQLSRVAGGDPAKAKLAEPGLSVGGGAMREARGMQGVDLRIRERAAPIDNDIGAFCGWNGGHRRS